MPSRETILRTIFQAVDDYNAGESENHRVDKSEAVVLLGTDGRLDSLGLVNLIVAVEQRLEEDFGVAVTLADEKAFSRKHSPFRTLGSLTDYVADVLEGDSNG